MSYTSGAPEKRTFFILSGIFVLALIIRLVYLFNLSDRFYWMDGITTHYIDLGYSIALGDGLTVDWTRKGAYERLVRNQQPAVDITSVGITEGTPTPYYQ